MRPIRLDLPFKGSRNYLRMADIYVELEQLARREFGGDSVVRSLTVRRPFVHDIELVFEQTAEAAGTFLVQTSAGQVAGWLVESALPVSRRVPFDSSPLVAMAVVGEGTALMRGPMPGHRAMDVAVELMKRLTEQLPIAKRVGQWWLCQLEMEEPLREICPIEARTRRVVGDRYLLIDLLQGGQRIGSARSIWAEGVREDSASQAG